jgi:outer membrane beta-barrel protein
MIKFLYSSLSKGKYLKKVFILFGFFTGLVTPVFSSENSVYNFSWLDPDKEVYVLQNRVFRKDGRLVFNLGYGITTSGPFVDSKSIQVRGGYFFGEEIGIEFLYAKNNGKENANALAVRNPGKAGTAPFRRIVDNYSAGMILWSPFYTKVNTFNKIFYLDWIFGLGFAKLSESNNLNEINTNGINLTEKNEEHTGLIWEVGILTYLSQNWGFRLDLTTVHYNANEFSTAGTSKEMVTNWDLTFSLTYLF